MKQNWLRFPPPLRLTIPALVLAFNVCFVAITAFIIISRDRDREIERIRSHATQQAVRLANAADEHLGEGKPESHREFFQHELRFLGTDPAVRMAVLCDADGRILYSSRPDLTGKPLRSATSAAATAMVTRVLAGSGPELLVVENDAVIAAQPVTTGGPGGSAIMLERDLSKPLAALRAHARSDILFGLSVMLLVCTGLWLALKAYLSNRARALVESARRGISSRGAHPLTGSDEFADVYRALRESEDRFRQVADNIHDVFYMVNADRSRVLYVSPAYEEVWGHPVSTVMESPNSWLQAIEEPDREIVMRQHDPLYRGASSVRMEYRIRRPDGTMRWIENRAFPVLDEDGRIYRIAGLARDVTERKLLERELLNATEHERRRIGRDLHDDLCQRLAAIKIKCELLVEGLKRGDPPDVVKATEVCTFIGDASALCRGVARSLVPVDLAGEGLMVALEKLVETVEALNEVPCFFYCPDSVMVESTNAAVHIYRITQEFINNAIRHGKPTRVDVRLESSTDFVRVEVVNDGQPYADPSPSNHGMGLKILHFRADAIGATMRIQPRSDGIPGTIATCLVPHSSCSNPDPPSKPS